MATVLECRRPRSARGPFPSQTIEHENKTKVDLLLWLATLLVQFRLCHPGEEGTQRGKKEEKQNTRCSHPRRLTGTPGGALLGTPGKAYGDLLRGVSRKLCARLARPAQRLAPTPGPPPWLRPSAAAPCISRPPAAPVGDVGRGQPPGGARSPRARSPRPDVSAPRSAPGVWRGPAATGPGRL